jgi:hypothetical protein
MTPSDLREAAEHLGLLAELAHYRELEGDHGHTSREFDRCENSTCLRRKELVKRLKGSPTHFSGKDHFARHAGGG